MRFEVLKGKQATWPVTELRDSWVPHACATDYADALQLVSEEAAKLLVNEHGITIEDAFIFLSVACDAGVAQAASPPRASARSRASRSRRSKPAPGHSGRSSHLPRVCRRLALADRFDSHCVRIEGIVVDRGHPSAKRARSVRCDPCICLYDDLVAVLERNLGSIPLPRDARAQSVAGIDHSHLVFGHAPSLST